MEVARKRKIRSGATMMHQADDYYDGDAGDAGDGAHNMRHVASGHIDDDDDDLEHFDSDEDVVDPHGMDVDFKSEKTNNNKKAYKVDPSLLSQLDAIGSDITALSPLKKRNPNVPHLPTWAVVDYGEKEIASYGMMDTHEGVLLNNLPPTVQELAILEDVLFLMTGINGKYIHITRPTNPNYGTPLTFSMSPSIDSTYHKLVEQILPMSLHYINVHKYVSSNDQFESGLVSHAMCAAINTILKDYLILVAQLESQLRENKLTLQKLWFYIQNEKKKMALLDHITSTATRSAASGGTLLNLLYTTQSHFASAHMGTEKWMFLLLQHAAAPYLYMLGQWIFKGKIVDPYGEFMVEEHMDQQKENLNDDVNDAYWEQKYTLRKDQVPIFLEKISDKILTTGKYLNVMAECGREVKFAEEDTILIYTNNHSEYIEKIEMAYDKASRKLLDLLCNELDLLNRLRSIKRYFLLDQGDFFTHFMDIALDELQKPTCDISSLKLKTLLELSLRTSSVADIDPYKDDLGIEFHPYTLLDMLLRIIHVAHGSIFVNPIGPPGSKNDKTKGLELFTFSYLVRWPLSLIISRKVLIKYQLIFRQLSFCKNVELQLSNEWILSTNAKFARGFQPAAGVRHKMIHFLQNFQYYMMVEVIEPNWHKFEAAFQKVRTVDEVLKLHTDFVDSCLHECMLTDPRLVRILMKLMAICEAFANVIKRLMDSIIITHTQDKEKQKASAGAGTTGTRAGVGAKPKPKPKHITEKVIAQPIFDSTLQSTIKNADEHFKYHLQLLLEALKAFSTTGESNHYMIHLLTRLDYNGFYSQYFATHPVVAPQKR